MFGSIEGLSGGVLVYCQNNLYIACMHAWTDALCSCVPYRIGKECKCLGVLITPAIQHVYYRPQQIYTYRINIQLRKKKVGKNDNSYYSLIFLSLFVLFFTQHRMNENIQIYRYQYIYIYSKSRLFYHIWYNFLVFLFYFLPPFLFVFLPSFLIMKKSSRQSIIVNV